MIAANEVGDDKVFECEDNHLIVLSRTARHDLGQGDQGRARASDWSRSIAEALAERSASAARHRARPGA